MNCDVCQQEAANFFYSHVAGGKVQKVNLCKGCAEEKGLTDPASFAMADMLEGVGEHMKIEGREHTGDLTCSACGFTQTDFKKTGRFGCSACYQVFSEGLDGLLEAMHKHTMHVGKTPALPSASGYGHTHTCAVELEVPELPLFEEPEVTPQQKLHELKLALTHSVEDEDYEEAARLRDAISQLEAQWDSSTGEA